ncbi:MAG: DUF1343 domain-containing protein [Pseudomonadota bacterium]
MTDARTSSPRIQRPVLPGLVVERDAGWPRLRGRRLGILANHTATDERGVPLWGLAREAGLDVGVLLGAEHGLWGVEQDMVPVSGGRDPLTGIPVVSLYGGDAGSLTPDPGILADLDAVIFDIQDVGSRYYTYQATLHRLLRAVSGRGPAVVVLDRPNPIGGRTVEGARLQPGFESFVGQAPMLNRHGMTVGELARWLVATERLDVALEIVPCRGWARGTLWEEAWAVPWIPPSPNMPTPATARVYPGACFLEGTGLSEARGTTTPFELLGAPWLDAPGALCEAMGRAWEGAVFRPAWFRPGFQKHAGGVCGGICVHVEAPDRFRPVRTYLDLIRRIRHRWPVDFSWRAEAYEFVQDIPAIDLLAGGTWARDWVEADGDPEELNALLGPQEDEWLEARRPFLLYGDQA